MLLNWFIQNTKNKSLEKSNKRVMLHPRLQLSTLMSARDGLQILRRLVGSAEVRPCRYQLSITFSLKGNASRQAVPMPVEQDLLRRSY